MEFYYLAGPSAPDEAVRFSAEESRHMVQVRRHRPGERVQAVDGRGRRYIVELLETAEDGVRGRVLSSSPAENEPRVRLTLAQAVLKGSHIAEVVGAATQLGAVEVLLFRSARTVAGYSRGRTARLRRVALEAMKCSRRALLPGIEGPLEFDELLARCRGYEPVLVAWEDERERALVDVLAGRPGQVMLVIGPEGGFDESEVEMFRRAGAGVFSLGPRPMRAELAATVAVSAVMYALGELGPKGQQLSRELTASRREV